MRRRGQIFLGGILLIFNISCASSRWVPTRAIPNERQGLFDHLGKLKSTHLAAKERQEKQIKVQNISRVQYQDSRKLFAKEENHSKQPAARIAKEFHFQWPVRIVKVTSPFGKRGRDFHEGIDLQAKSGTPVYASQAGVVLYAESRISGYGKMIVLRHPGKVNSLYAHNSKVLVKRGQRVELGQQIAVSGSTGRVSGPHVHFEIRKGVAAMNPLKFLPRTGRAHLAEQQLGKNRLGRMTASSESKVNNR